MNDLRGVHEVWKEAYGALDVGDGDGDDVFHDAEDISFDKHTEETVGDSCNDQEQNNHPFEMNAIDSIKNANMSNDSDEQLSGKDNVINERAEESLSPSSTKPSVILIYTKNDLEARFTEGIKKKEIANGQFVIGCYNEAIELYREALEFIADDVHIQGLLMDDESDTSKKETYKHERAIILANIAACYMKLEKWDLAVTFCTRALESNSSYIKAILRRAQAREKLADTQALSEALKDYELVLTLEKGNLIARNAVSKLPIQIAERQEQEKAEMLSKLKDVGNKLLGKFGLSTNNFQFVKDPTTGSYSVNFNKNT